MSADRATLDEANRLLKCGDIDGARGVCAPLVENFPQDWRVQLAMARVEMRSQNFEASLDRLDLAEENGAPQDMLDRIEKNLAQRMNDAEALPLKGSGVPLDPQAAMAAIEENIRDGRVEAAHDIMQVLLQQAPDQPISDEVFADLLDALGPELFEARIESLLDAAPVNFSLRVCHATNLVEAGAFESASAQIQKALAAAPGREISADFWEALIAEAEALSGVAPSVLATIKARPNDGAVLAVAMTALAEAEALNEASALAAPGTAGGGVTRS